MLCCSGDSRLFSVNRVWSGCRNAEPWWGSSARWGLAHFIAFRGDYYGYIPYHFKLSYLMWSCVLLKNHLALIIWIFSHFVCFLCVYFFLQQCQKLPFWNGCEEEERCVPNLVLQSSTDLLDPRCVVKLNLPTRNI